MKAILFSLILALTSTFVFAQRASINPELNSCPVLEQWSLTFPIVSFLGLKDAPAKIVSTLETSLLENAVSQITLKNNSGKIITSVKIKWFLYRGQIKEAYGVTIESADTKILLERETPSIDTGEFKPNEETVVLYPLGNCVDIYKAFNEDGNKIGEPFIEPSISEILYADGSKWSRNEKR